MVPSRLISCLVFASAFLLLTTRFAFAQAAVIAIPAGNSLLCNPFNGGNGNGADKILTLSPLSDTYSQPANTLNSFYILTWNGVFYNSVYYENDFTAANTRGAVTNGWATDGSGTAQATPPTLNPGVGFFICNAGKPVTNVFIGTITPGPGQTNTLTIPAGKSLIASRLPVSGLLTSSSFQFPIAGSCCPAGSLTSFCVLTWNGSGFDNACYDAGLGWQGTIPTINIGQSFFIKDFGPTATWSQAANLP